jgi:hypothetical protein
MIIMNDNVMMMMMCIYIYTSQYHDDMTATDGIQVWEAAIFFMTRTKYAEVSNKTMIYPLVN